MWNKVVTEDGSLLWEPFFKSKLLKIFEEDTMKHIFALTFAALFCVCIASTSGFAADTSKIGLVDFQKILKESSAGKFARQKINKRGQQLEKNLKGMQDKIEGLREKLEKESLVMSQEKREQKKREIRIKINDFKQKNEQYKKEFQKMRQKVINNMKKEVFDLAQKIGKKEGYLLIMEKNTAGVLYYSDSIDITDDVITKYNENISELEQ